MKKIIAALFSTVLLAAAVAAQQAADSIYTKKGTFPETVLQLRANYAEWLEKARKQDNGLRFGDWFGSQTIDRERENALNYADPTKNPINTKDILGREPLWKKLDIKDGELFAMHVLNKRLRWEADYFVAREIQSDSARDFVFTFGSEVPASVWINGVEIAKTKGAADGARIFKCRLQKGKNMLVFKMGLIAIFSNEEFYFVPYASPVVDAAKKLSADFPVHADILRSISQFGARSPYYARIPSSLLVDELISSSDITRSFADTFKACIEHSLFSAGKFQREYAKIKDDSSAAATAAKIELLDTMIRAMSVERALGYSVENVRAAMQDIKKTYPEYDKDGALFAELKKWEAQIPQLKKELFDATLKPNVGKMKAAEQFKNFASKALLANPLLKKYPKWVFIKRDNNSRRMGLPNNWQGNSVLATRGGSNSKRDRKVCDTFKDELYTLDIAKPDSAKLLFKPSKNNIIADLDVSFDGKKILFSTFDEHMHFRMDELDTVSGKTKTLTPTMHRDIDYYDGVYLPDGDIVFCSTACWVGVPCVAGVDYVANLYKMNPNAGDEKAVDDSIRQLTFEQDADWMPVLMENGRIMYTRWEYVDNSHYFSRILMHMNPDGTAQSSLYGSTSYWPNSLFYARQIPNDPNKFVGIVSGHHGIARSGELHMFDISKGTKEESGRVHQYPSYGREYVAETKDQLVKGKTPQIIHPYPLSENYIVASARYPSLVGTSNFGLFLIDKFDNMTPLQFFKDAAAFEPMPLQARQKPAEIADKTNPDVDFGYVFLNDIYQGEGLKDVPRGTVKELRILEYVYAYRDMGAHDIIGNEGSWDIKRIYGTVPVLEDGSAMFKVPANRPLALQPLDKDGKALALMRTWFTVMPGEVQSCVGCHEGQGMSPTSKPALASRAKPSEIKPFVAGVRGYSFERDVQPILDKYCVGCHDGSDANRPNFKRGVKGYAHFPHSYLELAKYVRRSGPECNQNMLAPLEFNADTSELIQLLKKGHKGVKLDDTSMRALITWMDFNVPCFGSWYEIKKDIPHQGDKMRAKYLAKYANRHDDLNAIVYDGGKQQFQMPAAAQKHTQSAPKADGFPFDADKAKAMRENSKSDSASFFSRLFGGGSLPSEIVADVDGAKIRFVLVPAGSYVMGSNGGFFDEGPATLAKIEKPFYMSQFEITNAQFAKFDPAHNSGYHDRQWKDHVNRGYPANLPNQPVVRVNWNRANDYCAWLSEKLGVKVSLPTEKQWEWAARAGTDGDFWFGDKNTNYGACENLADCTIKNFAVYGIDPQPLVDESPLNTYTPFDAFANDGQLVGCDVGMFKPNAFGLYDMLGNVAEWTADDFTETLGGKVVPDKKTVRGGSWRDRAKRSRVSIRRDYHPWQKVYNVGMRLVIDDAEAAAKLMQKAEPLPAPAARDINPPVDTVPHD